MSELQLGQMRIPDILETIADLSNDEVFTPPQLANKVLDTLPEEIWSNSKITFLDPACKTGVFLREIAKRLIVGLEEEIPDLQERVNHILTKQVYGLGITELTALMSRRTVYCATKANSEASVVTAFDNEEGNIKFPKSKHIFNEKTKKCTICGAGKDLYEDIEGLDNYAYSFLHDNLKEVFGNVKFDVIIGNPPYQLEDGGGGVSSIPLYDKFVEKAISLRPDYISMIIPSRWFIGGKGLDNFRNIMINSNKIKKLTDYPNSQDVFPQVGVNGGVNFFLWDNKYKGKCEITRIVDGVESKSIRELRYSKNLEVFISDNVLFNLAKKVEKHNEGKFMDLVSPRDPYRINDSKITSKKGDFIVYEVNERKDRFISKDNLERIEYHYKHKIFVSFAYGISRIPIQVINKPFIPEENSVCTGTYLTIGPFASKEETENALYYMKTKFFRALVLAMKNTQHGTQKVYEFVPIQDFSKRLKDEDLYSKYNLTPEEIAYIENVIKPID